METVRWLISNIVLFLILQKTYGQRRGWNWRPKSCKTSHGDTGRCISARYCWYDEDDLYDFENVCGYGDNVTWYCCPYDLSNNLKSSRTADTKCQEYSRLDTNSGGLRGNDIFSSEIVMGEKSSTKEFPHMAALGYGSVENIQWKCGGSLISDLFVLTAAHCLRSSAGEPKVVRLGDLNLKSDTDQARPQQFTVTQKIPHPQYRTNSDYHDIGLVKLDSPVKYTSFVRPACLETSLSEDSQRFIATGWGSVEFAGRQSDILQKVDLDRFPNERCGLIFGPERQLQDGLNTTIQFCAGGFEDGKDTCQGDSGGPLQVKLSSRPIMYKIVGITSFGKGCGLEKVPGVYTKVSHYVPWIEEMVWS